MTTISWFHGSVACVFLLFFIQLVQEVEVAGGKRVIIVFVPVPQIAKYQKLIKERSLIEELEKKFSGKQVLIISQRRIIRKETRNTMPLKQKRPRSRTLTAVHEAILDDIVFPNEITGKRIRFRHDGSRLLRVFLHQETSDADKVCRCNCVHILISAWTLFFPLSFSLLFSPFLSFSLLFSPFLFFALLSSAGHSLTLLLGLLFALPSPFAVPLLSSSEIARRVRKRVQQAHRQDRCV